MWIISDKNEQIAPVVMEKMHRGITRFPASGVYTQQEKSVLLCVVSIKQIPYLKEIVMEIDENSFLIVGAASSQRNTFKACQRIQRRHETACGTGAGDGGRQ